MRVNQSIANPHTRTVAGFVVLCVLLVVSVALNGCADDPGGERVENLPPNVWLSSAPPEGTATKYRIRLFWGGWDPDGEIAYYEYAITDNEGGTFSPADTAGADKWHRVLANDSLFTFSADILADTNTTDLVSRFERSHTFFVRAVDELGLPSAEPAYRSFTSWTLSPEINITVPRSAGLTPALVPSIATYRWTARDFVNSDLEIQDPDSVRHILHPVSNNNFLGGVEYIRKTPDAPGWSKWSWYKAPNDSGRFWTTPPTDLGTYVFAVQAKDEAGAVTPVFDEKVNVRRIRVSQRSTGPILDVYNEFIGTVRTSVTSTPPVIVDLPAGVPMQFTFEADAEGYGGLVSGYRYGWDIADISDPDQWEVDYTPFTSNEAKTPPRTFYFGTHTFNVEVIDNSGAASRVEVKVNYVQFTMERSLLLVDDYNPTGSLGTTNGAVPSDAELDSFWASMVGDVADFAPENDVIQVKAGEPISIVKFATYKSVIWDAFGSYNSSPSARPKLYELIHFRSEDPSLGASSGKVQPNLLSLFTRAGGHLFLCGNQPMTQAITIEGFYTAAERYPFIFKYELEGDQDGNYSDQVQNGNFVGDKSFPWDDACVNVIDIAYPGYSELRNKIENGCGVNLVRQINPQQEGLREAIPLDPMYPTLELRPEVAGPGKAYAPNMRGLNSELYNPPYFATCPQAEIKNLRECFQPVYGHGCLNTASPIYNAPIAFWSSRYGDIVPEVPDDGVAARSFYLGVEPFYFKPAQFKELIDMVLFDEWQLPRL